MATLLGVCPIAAGTTTGCASDEGEYGAADSEQVSASPFWRHTLTFPKDPFAKSEGASPSWVKFSILTSDPTKVYFQDSNKYVFHIDFAKNHLPGFANVDPATFEQLALRADNQKVILGVVLFPPKRSAMEFGIQLVREDEFSREDVKRWHDLVKSKIVVEDGKHAQPFYMPTFEQQAAAQRERTWLHEHDVMLGSPDRWMASDACYAAGWAFGQAKFIPGTDIKKAFIEGRLTTTDILVTDGVPAEVPPVAGLVSLAPSTPSSHVAILAKTWGIPFVFPKSEDVRQRIKDLAGKEIGLRTVHGYDSCSVDVIVPQGTIDAETREAIAALKRPAPVDIPKKAHLGRLTRDTAELQPGDVRHFGGKASNFGTLRRSIPNNSPVALGVSFDLWDAFVAQTLPTGKTLKEEIDARLRNLTFPPAVLELEAKLEEIRAFIADAKFPAAERTKLFADLGAFGFESNMKLRFRSSTNVEDGDVLSGAGLYDSFSGCLADDLDQDETGPSVCDPAEKSERGVERAIKKVFASFFNTNAVLERIRYGIREEDVGMALAVHRSFPDEREAANGVATVDIYTGAPSAKVTLVTQLGAESVTNPTGAALPETVVSYVEGANVRLKRETSSTLVPAGGTVMQWEADYAAISKLIVVASNAFIGDRSMPPGTEVSLDIEYKKDTDGSLVLKQIRRLPNAPRAQSTTAVLLNEGLELCTTQSGGGTGVLARHRGKVRGTVDLRSTPLSEQAIARSLVSALDLRIVENGSVVSKNGNPSSLIGAAYDPRGTLYVNRWTSPRATFELGMRLDPSFEPPNAPLKVGRDGNWMLILKHTSPVPELDRSGDISSVTEESVALQRCVPPQRVVDSVHRMEARAPHGVQIQTQLRFEKHPDDASVVKTEALGAWESTQISGLTSAPIALRGWFSQTFVPGHHNLDEAFVFEPGLEEGIDPRIVQELDAKDIQALIVQNVNYNTLEHPRAKYFVLKKSTQTIVPF